MKESLPGNIDYLNASMKTAQYLSGLSVSQDIWSETGKVLVSFFGADLGTIGERRQDGEIVIRQGTFSERFTGRVELDDEIRETIAEVLESGFLALRIISTPVPLSLAILPVTQENRVIAVMLAGHGISELLPKELLNVYLAVAGLVGTAFSRLALEMELRGHRQHLEQLVQARTAELTATNEQLQREIIERNRAEERIRQQVEVMNGINGIFQEAMTSPTKEELGERCLAVAEEITGSRFGFIGEIGPDGWLHDIAISNPGWDACTMINQSGHRRPPVNFKLNGIHGRVLLDGKGFFINNPSVHPDSIKLPSGHPPLTSFLSVPLVCEGTTYGIIAVGNRPEGYCLANLEALEALAPAVVEVFLRNKAEVALIDRGVKLMRAEEMAHLGHWHHNLVTGKITLSDEIFRIFGLHQKDSSPDYMLEELTTYCHPDDMEQCGQSFNPSGQEDGKSYEYRIMRSDGEERHVVSKVELVRDEDGKVIAAFGTTLDTSELKRKERELQEKNAEMERFTYMISHDLKSPLVTLKTFLGYLHKDLANNDASRIDKDMHFMRTAADRMCRLLDELLEMSRVGRMVNQPESVACSEVVEEALNLVAGSIAERGVEVRVAVPDIILFGDRPRLVEIWQNLLENACKFMGAQAHPRIEIGSEGSGRGTVFFVHDNGEGIEPQFQEKVFGMFERLNRNIEGTGIGLALIKRIVELNGGTIRVESQGSGQGSCFRFTLPGTIKYNRNTGKAA